MKEFNPVFNIQIVALLLSILWLLHRGCDAETYWAYVPNPPVIHPVTWDENVDIPVYINQTKYLDQYSDSHILQFHAFVNYSGRYEGSLLCFTKNLSEHCEQIKVQDDWDNNFNAGIHWALDFYYPVLNNPKRGPGRPPQRIPVCRTVFPPKSDFSPYWRYCHANETVCSDTSLCDWNILDNTNHRPINLAYGIWTKNNETYFSSIWKAVAALGMIKVKKLNITWIPVGGIMAFQEDQNKTEIYARACVPEPYAFLSGNLLIDIETVKCTNCQITNCVNSTFDNFLVVKQPDYVFLPVNVSEGWYENTGTEILKEATSQLVRQKRVIGMIIAGIAALIVAITVTTIASVSLVQSIQTAAYVNGLAINVTKALQAQENWDEKIEMRLNSLKDTVDLLGRQVQTMSTRESLICHEKYKIICVTPVVYNSTMFPWDKIIKHLQGVWDNTNTSLDLGELKNHIQDIINAPRPQLDLAKQTKAFIDALKASFPSFSGFKTWLGSLFALILICVCGCLFLPYIIRLFVKQMNAGMIEMKKLKLHSTKDTPPPEFI